MSNRRVLAICSDLDLLRRMVAVLEDAGAEVDAVRSPAAIATEVVPHRYIFVVTSDPYSLQPLITRLRYNAHVAVVTPRASLADMIEFLRDDRVNHVVIGESIDGRRHSVGGTQSPGDPAKPTRDGAGGIDRAIATIAKKWLTGDIFGIERYLPVGTPVSYARILDFEGRGLAVQTVLEYAERQKMRRQVRGAIGSACEELLMNALYDAPVDAFGKSVFADLDPHQRTQQRSPRPVSIRFAATDELFAIAVRDRFGRLAKNTIISYLEKCISRPNQIDRKIQGAGLGLYLVASSASSYIVNVAYGVATEVVCTFDRGVKTSLRLAGVFVHPRGAQSLKTGPTPEAAADEPGDQGPSGGRLT